jgi:hypothetical protein
MVVERGISMHPRFHKEMPAYGRYNSIECFHLFFLLEKNKGNAKIKKTAIHSNAP